VDIRDNGSVDGDIVSPRVAIAEGAHFRGSVDMQRKGGQPAAKAETKADGKAAAPQPAPAVQAHAAAPAQRVGA
jgi:cytoskeletal protein CcmA (bactofilin family)